MKKLLQIIYCALILAACAFFTVAMAIPGASDAAEGAEMPSLINGSGTVNQDFGNEFEEYFAKAFAFRDTMVDAFSAFKLTVFAEGNEQVVVGRDSYLFFAETLNSYTGEASMTDAEIASAADALLSLYEYAKAHDARFLFVAAPNKNSIYSEKMPARYQMLTEGRELDRLYLALDARGVPYLDLRPILVEAKAEKQVYHKRDTHWNTEGARIAWEAMAERLSVETPDFDAIGADAVTDFRGDLDTLLFPKRVVYDENTAYRLTERFVFTSAYATPMDMIITTRGGGKEKLLMFRDSFANAQLPLIAASFSETQLERAVPYRADLLKTFDADVVIVEIAERNLRTLIGSDERIR